MSKILVIAENYFYSESPDTNCLRHVLNGLVEHGHEVVLFAPLYKNNVTIPEKFTVKYFYQKEQEKIDNRFGIKSTNPLVSYVIYAMRYLAVKKQEKNRKKEYLKEFEKINAGNKKFDCLLSFYCPVNSHIFAEYITAKHPDLKWFLYFLDPHTYNQDYYRSKKAGTIHSRATDEKKWAKYAYGIISSYGILEENARHNFYPYKNLKNLEVHLPNMKLNQAANIPSKTNNTKIRMVYTGKFYSDIRNPEPLIKMLNLIDSNSISAEFYGSCCDYLKNNYSTLPNCVELKGSVSQEECKKITDNADILLNVGNTTLNQVPSKVFEYIVSGKPIINIYSSENDTSLFYLNKYPNALNIASNSEFNKEEINQFINNRSFVSKDTLYDIYKEYLSDSIISKINDFLEAN